MNSSPLTVDSVFASRFVQKLPVNNVNVANGVRRLRKKYKPLAIELCEAFQHANYIYRKSTQVNLQDCYCCLELTVIE